MKSSLTQDARMDCNTLRSVMCNSGDTLLFRDPDFERWLLEIALLHRVLFCDKGNAFVCDSWERLGWFALAVKLWDRLLERRVPPPIDAFTIAVTDVIGMDNNVGITSDIAEGYSIARRFSSCLSSAERKFVAGLLPRIARHEMCTVIDDNVSDLLDKLLKCAISKGEDTFRIISCVSGLCGKESEVVVKIGGVVQLIDDAEDVMIDASSGTRSWATCTATAIVSKESVMNERVEEACVELEKIGLTCAALLLR